MTTETRRAVTLMLNNKRLGFPDLAEARSIKSGKPVFGARIIIDPSDPDVAVIDAAIKEVATTQWKDKADAVLAMLYDKGRVAFLKKDYRNTAGEVYKGFEGKFSLGASAPEDKQPTCVNAYGEKMEDPATIRRVLYSGCYAHFKVELYPLLREDGNRISCALLGVMFAGDGESFGGGTAPASVDDFAQFAKAKADAGDVL